MYLHIFSINLNNHVFVHCIFFINEKYDIDIFSADNYRTEIVRIWFRFSKLTPNVLKSKKTLIKTCETRWVDRHESLIRFKELYKAIDYALEQLEEYSN